MGSPPGWRTQFNCPRRSRRKALYPLMPSVAKMPSILLTIDRLSLVKSSRSRFARRASSSASLGIGTIEQTRGSPLSQAIKVRSNISTSIMSVFARRARRSALGLQTLDKRNQPVAASIQRMPRMPANFRQLNRQNPLFLAQFDRADDGGVVVDGSLRGSRELRHPLSP